MVIVAPAAEGTGDRSLGCSSDASNRRGKVVNSRGVLPRGNGVGVVVPPCFHSRFCR